MAGFDEVSQLTPYKSMWRIKVKIIRMWKQYTAQGGETIEMVLVDSKGDKIHASVKKDLVEQFDPVLMEGFTKILINFAIAFVSSTKVRPYEELPMNLTGFTPAKFLDVLDGSLNTDYLVDVIGQIVEYSHVKIVSVNGKDTEKITVELCNEKLTIVLWGKFAMNVSDAIQLRADHAVVCVLRFGKIKVWKGSYKDRSVSNAYNVSDIAINPSMNEVKAFLALKFKPCLMTMMMVGSPTFVPSVRFTLLRCCQVKCGSVKFGSGYLDFFVRISGSVVVNTLHKGEDKRLSNAFFLKIYIIETQRNI
ncbi:hypothetical protein Bca4012_043562 [Brassica carinata]|uniref:Replication protein A 70 kDa DNA-binding subunit B/D first OB fold domain-containing protein n=1 Tax=Brassica carinata TaxID=52824 RepID=A0A8X7QTU9_BRACI|nr:hypothetical protein Bca52824_058772 [Brassica carinata]